MAHLFRLSAAHACRLAALLLVVVTVSACSMVKGDPNPRLQPDPRPAGAGLYSGEDGRFTIHPHSLDL